MSRNAARPLAPFFLCAALVTLVGCSKEPAPEAESADEFATRINAPAQADATNGPPAATARQVPPMPQAEVDKMIGPVEEGSMTAPDSASCGAPAGEDWLGRKFTPALTTQIDAIVPEGGSVRVLGSDQPITGLKTPDRLNIMLDENGIIRDFRCG